MSSEYIVRLRLTIPFFSILSLAVAILNSANAYFALILRDRARSDHIDTTDDILDNQFQSVQSKALSDTVATALINAAFAIYGAVITFHPRWLRENDEIARTFGLLQMTLSFVMIVTGAYLTDHVNGYQTSFEKFGANDSIYGMMYYGGVAQAAYGSVLVFLAITVVVLVFTYDHYNMKRYLAQVAASEATMTEVAIEEAAASSGGKGLPHV